MADTWSKEEREALGRPLVSWDICPTCGKQARAHMWVGADLVCIELRYKGRQAARERARLDAEEKLARLQDEREARKLEALELDRIRAEGRKAGLEFRRKQRAAEQEAAERKKQGNLVTTPDRRYFDE